MIGIIHRMYPSDGVLCCGEEENIRKNEGGGEEAAETRNQIGTQFTEKSAANAIVNTR